MASGGVAVDNALGAGEDKSDLASSEELRAQLLALIARPSTEQRYVLRAQIVLLSVLGGESTGSVATQLEVTAPTVRKWSTRFAAERSLEALKDGERSGRKRKIGVREEATVVSLACQHPEGVGRLEAKMFQRVIVEEARKQNVELSRSSVQRILARSELRPHKDSYYLFTPKDREDYKARRDAIIDLYLAKLPSDEVLICFDEKSGIQVLRRDHPARPALPGQPVRIEHNYKRLGSRTMVSAVRPDTGELVLNRLFERKGYKTSQTISVLRDLLTVLVDFKKVHLIWDNASTHVSKKMKEFLESDDATRLAVYYTPAHASWLNAAENFFSRFSRRYLGRIRRFESLEQFDDHIGACTQDWNKQQHKPFHWEYDPRKREAA